MATELGELRARLLLESQQFRQGMQEARDQMNQTGDSAKNVSRDFDRIQTASMAVGAAVVTAIGASVKTAADFESQMSRVKAISGATDEEFKNLEKSALDLGASTSKSASEVAIAFEGMAAKGFDANEIMAAMPGVIAAAEASGSDLALTSDVVASALNGFQMEASEASKVADILAKTANISAASVDDMGYAFKYVAPIANSLGISIEEVSAAVGIMTNAGLDGSSAGTALRAALLALNNPAEAQAKIMGELGFSMKDSNGEAKSLSQIFADLTEATKGMTDAERVATIAKLVGTEASSGMIAVMEGGADQLNEFTNELKNSAGASKEAADIMKDNLKGAVDEFQGAVETAGIKLGDEFLPILTEITKKGAEVVSTLADMDMSALKSGLAFAGTTAAIALTITTISKLAIAVRGLMVSMGPAGWLIAGISLLGGVIAGASVKYEEMNELTLEHVEASQKEIDSLSTMTGRFDELKGKMTLTTDELGRFLDINNEIARTSDPEVIQRLKDEQEKLKQKSGLTNAEFSEFLSLNDKIIEKVPQSNVVLSDQGNIMVENTKAAKKLTEEKAKQLRIDLETEQANLESKQNENIRNRKNLQVEINALMDDRKTKEAEIEAQTVAVGELETKLRDAKKNGDEVAITQLENELVLQEVNLQKLRDQYAENMNNINAKSDELAKIDEQLGKLDKVKDRLISLELQQVGINAKKGEEIQQIDSAVAKLEAEKQKLIEQTPVKERNTQEFKNSVGAIDSQIASLNVVKERVIEITGAAAGMNITLREPIYKDVVINERRYQVRVGQNYMGRVPEGSEYHTGGIIGRGQMPQLHVGGLASQFMDAPLHNEIDVRLLRNEAVFTEAQQANLMRMIDAGFIGGNGSGNTELVKLMEQLIYKIDKLGDRPIEGTVVMDGREAGEIIGPHIRKIQQQMESSHILYRGDPL